MRIEKAMIDSYGAYLKDRSRPPSKGGNTKAWHQHVLTIVGEKYSFLALGARKWVFASDTVSFDWDWDATQQYRNIDRSTLIAFDKSGKAVARGVKGTKQWRSAEARMPASRREQRD